MQNTKAFDVYCQNSSRKTVDIEDSTNTIETLRSKIVPKMSIFLKKILYLYNFLESPEKSQEKTEGP